MVSGDGTASAAAVVADALVQQREDGTAGPAAPAPVPDAEALARVRHELQRLPRWRQALADAEAAPQDAAVRAALVEAVDEVLTFNSALAQSLGLDLETAQATTPATATAFEKAPAAPPAPPTAPQDAVPGPPPVPSAPPAPPSAPPAPAFAPPLPPAGPVEPAVALAAKRKRIVLGVGAAVVAGGLVALGSYLFGGGSAPSLPKSVEGDALRNSSAKGDFPDWEDMNSSMTEVGARNLQGATYGVVPKTSSSSSSSKRDPRWNVVIGTSSPDFRRKLAQLAARSDSGSAPHVVKSSLDGTLYCDSYDPDDSPTERARETITCVWADDDYMIVVAGTGVDENLVPRVLERVHGNSEH